MVDVKIIKDKKIVKSINNIYKPQVIRMNGTRPGERYVIRVIDGDENPWGNKVEVRICLLVSSFLTQIWSCSYL